MAVRAGLAPPYKPRLVDPGIARQGQKPDQCRYNHTASPCPCLGLSIPALLVRVQTLQCQASIAGQASDLALLCRDLLVWVCMGVPALPELHQ